MSNGMTSQISTWGLQLFESNVFTMGCGIEVIFLTLSQRNSRITLSFLDNIRKDELPKWQIVCKAFVLGIFFCINVSKGIKMEVTDIIGCKGESNKVYMSF